MLLPRHSKIETLDIEFSPMGIPDYQTDYFADKREGPGKERGLEVASYMVLRVGCPALRG
jgi:hypothetical protein